MSNYFLRIMDSRRREPYKRYPALIEKKKRKEMKRERAIAI
jgi:hypothetical protein